MKKSKLAIAALLFLETSCNKEQESCHDKVIWVEGSSKQEISCQNNQSIHVSQENETKVVTCRCRNLLGL
jgi:hypothetical protein